MKARILTITTILILSIACGMAPIATATPTPAVPTETAVPDPEENPAGAVFEVPEEWTEPGSRLCAIVTADVALHVRAARNEKAPVLDYLYNGEKVKVLDPSGRWWKVHTAENVEGYANSKYLDEEKCP